MHDIKLGDNIRLTDFFELDMLQSIQDSFFGMTNLAMGFSDEKGQAITEHHSRHNFCTKYTKGSPIGRMRCQECDERCAKIVGETKELYISRCHNGLVDFVAPIVVDGRLLGTFHGGQVLTEPMDEAEIRRKAQIFGIDPDEYVEAAKHVPIMKPEDIESQANFIFEIANSMSKLAYFGYNMKLESTEIEREAHMKSDFLANMSHEIRTPMNAVIGMAEMALREELPPEARKYINQIKSAGDSLLAIINDILDFSKIESGKMSINLVEYEPLSVVNDVTNIVMTRIGNKNLEFIVDYDPNIPYQIMGDSIRIKQIIMNLANNAIKFTKEGRVKLILRYERTAEHEVMLRVAVSDTGIGIKKEDLGKLFQSFTQVDSKRNRNIEGTGLGLAISKQLVTLMNGRIGVESEYGKGSTFFFEVPQILLKEAPSVSMKNPRNILAGIFTDNPYILESLNKVCNQLGAQTKTILLVDQLEALIEEGAEFLFIDQPMFGTPVQHFVEKHKELTCVLMTAFHSQVSYAIPNLLVVSKPLYSLNVATIFNREEIYRDLDPERNEQFDFIAPEAEILIVDDNEINLTVAEGIIRPIQARVTTALSGKEAIDKISVKHYDLIFMDHMMPELDGIETTHIIRRFHEEYNDVPIIALTANAMEESKSMFLVEGMNDFIAKPIEIKIISSKLRQWLPKDKIHHITEEKRREAKEKAQNTTSDSKIGRLQETGIFDVKAAVAMLGSEELFWTVLKDYFKVIDKKAALIKVFFEGLDWKNYTIEVHALKSASKQIGAMALSELAAKMEKAANDKNYGFIVENQEKMLHMYEGCKIALEPFMEKEDNTSLQKKGSVSKAELLQLFSKLRQALDNLDMDSMEDTVRCFAEYCYPQEQQELLIQLKDAVENLDVDTCADVLQQWESLL